MTKPLHSGLAAECAVMSADLAALGYTASATILEGRWGFFQAKGGGHFDERIRGLLGNPWCFVDRGVWLKPWPTGSLTHPAFTKMQGLVMEHDLRPDQVAKIRVKTSDSIQDVIAFHRPKTALQGKFSMQFGLATMLLERKVTLGHFTDEFVARKRHREFDPDQAVRVKGYQLKACGITLSWEGVRRALRGQDRITVELKRADGATVHVRKSSRAEPRQREIYDALGISSRPGNTEVTIIEPSRRQATV